MQRTPVTVYNSPGGLQPITLLNLHQFITGYYSTGDLGQEPWSHYWVPANQYPEFISQSEIFQENVPYGKLVHTVYYFPDNFIKLKYL